MKWIEGLIGRGHDPIYLHTDLQVRSDGSKDMLAQLEVADLEY
jgi:hypothetical protein